jgi:hypothetical protein
MVKTTSELSNHIEHFDPELGDLLGLPRTVGTIGEKKNYNFQPGVTQYVLWPFSTIEWEPDEDKYKARVIVRHQKTNDSVVFNSWHQDYSDAERAIDIVRHTLAGTAERPVYNIFGETIHIHTSDHGGGTIVNVTEVLALIWSMTEGPTP